MANQEHKIKFLKKIGVIILSVAGVLAFIYLISFLDAGEPFSEDIIREYRKAVTGSKEVAEMTNSVADKVEEINGLEEAEISATLNLIEEARVGNEEARVRASDLLYQLEDLTNMVLEIESHKQKIDLAEAVYAELVLVKEFVNYTSDINRFLDSLSVAVVSDEASDVAAVQQSLRTVNERRRVINDLSDRFLAKASQLGIFD